MIQNPVYEPHSHAEVTALVAPEVAARLDKNESYGLWYYADIPVPVVASGLSREIVQSARERIKDNKRTSSAGYRTWTLSGGTLRCAHCGTPMVPSITQPRGKRYFYYRCSHSYRGWPLCENTPLLPAEETEEMVWAFVADLFRDPVRLWAEFDRMIERDKRALKADPDKNAKAAARQINELDAQRARATDLAIEGLITKDDLAIKLQEIAAQRVEAVRELESARRGVERIRELEAKRDELFADFAALTDRRLDSLSPEEKMGTYRYLDLRIEANADGELRVSGTFNPIGSVCTDESRTSTASVPT